MHVEGRRRRKDKALCEHKILSCSSKHYFIHVGHLLLKYVLVGSYAHCEQLVSMFHFCWPAIVDRNHKQVFS